MADSLLEIKNLLDEKVDDCQLNDNHDALLVKWAQTGDNQVIAYRQFRHHIVNLGLFDLSPINIITNDAGQIYLQVTVDIHGQRNLQTSSLFAFYETRALMNIVRIIDEQIKLKQMMELIIQQLNQSKTQYLIVPQIKFVVDLGLVTTMVNEHDLSYLRSDYLRHYVRNANINSDALLYLTNSRVSDPLTINTFASVDSTAYQLSRLYQDDTELAYLVASDQSTLVNNSVWTFFEHFQQMLTQKPKSAAKVAIHQQLSLFSPSEGAKPQAKAVLKNDQIIAKKTNKLKKSIKDQTIVKNTNKPKDNKMVVLSFVDNKDELIKQEKIKLENVRSIDFISLVPLGWELVENHVIDKRLNELIHNSSDVTLEIKHRHRQVSFTKPLAENTKTVSGKLIMGAHDSDLNKTITRTIMVEDPRTNKVTKHIQSIDLHRDAVVDEVTGEVDYGEWDSNNWYWPSFKPDTIGGYAAQPAEVPVEKVQLTKDKIINVVYKRLLNAKPTLGNQKVRFVDANDKHLIKEVIIKAPVGERRMLQSYVPTNYRLADHQSTFVKLSSNNSKTITVLVEEIYQYNNSSSVSSVLAAHMRIGHTFDPTVHVTHVKDQKK